MKGDVAVDGDSRPLLLAELAKGQKIVVSKDAQAAVMYIGSGKEFVLKGPGEFVVKDAEVGASSGAAPVARTTEWRASSKVLGQVAQTASASVRMRSIAPAEGRHRRQAALSDAGQRRHAAADVPLAHRRSEDAGRVRAA